MKLFKSLLIAVLCYASASMAQTVIQGGERFAYNALPAQISITMPFGEKRIFSMEETLATGCLWQARPKNAAQQILTTHTLQEATGGQAVPMGLATFEITGNIASTSVIDFVLIRPADPNATPIATVTAQLNIAAPAPATATVVITPAPVVVPAPVIVTPAPAAPAPVVAPAPLLPANPMPPQRVPLKNECFYPFKDIPTVADIIVPKDGHDIEIFLDCPRPHDYEWIAVWHDNGDIKIDIDNDEEEEAFVPGHKHKRTIRCTSVEITGYHPCEARVRLEYRKKEGRRLAPAAKAIECLIRVR